MWRRQGVNASSPSVLSARCWIKFFSAMGLAIPAVSIAALVSSARCTTGSSHRLMTLLCAVFLSARSSKSGQIAPRRPRAVMLSWALSNACANEPKGSAVADPLGPSAALAAAGREAESVSRFLPNKNSDAVSSEKRPYRSCASHGVWEAARAPRMDRVWAQWRSKISKSSMRSRAKNGRAVERCCGNGQKGVRCAGRLLTIFHIWARTISDFCGAGIGTRLSPRRPG